MLSREQIEAAKNCFATPCHRCNFKVGNGAIKADCIGQVAQTALILMDQVEAQQKEIEQLEKFKQDSLGLIQRHEKLKERHAAYRETLKQAREALKCTPYYTPNIEEALEAIDKAIGGGQ